MYAMTKELKKKPFNGKVENVKQANDIQVTFILEIKLQKSIFQQIMATFLVANVSFLNHCYGGNVHMYDTM